MVGYTLGGGIGWLARAYGLACNSVLAVEAVTADGRIVRADADHEHDLFWALRGGGGSFAVVTALEFALYPVAEVYAGALFWPSERAAEVLHAWRELIAAAPDELTSLGRLMQFPPFPQIPESLRGRSFVLVEAAYCGPEADGAELLQPLRELGPEMDTVATIPVDGLSELHMDPPQPVPCAGDGMLLSELPAEAVDALVSVAGAGSGSPLLSVEVRQLGGALADAAATNGALSSIDAGFALYAVGIAGGRGLEGRRRGPHGQGAGHARALGRRTFVHELHGAERRSERALRRHHLFAAPKDQGRSRPRQPDPRQPLDPACLTGTPGRGCTSCRSTSRRSRGARQLASSLASRSQPPNIHTCPPPRRSSR